MWRKRKWFRKREDEKREGRWRDRGRKNNVSREEKMRRK